MILTLHKLAVNKISSIQEEPFMERLKVLGNP